MLLDGNTTVSINIVADKLNKYKMERYTKQIRRTLGLLSSMVRSGENHSKDSEQALRNSLNALEQLDLYIVRKTK